MGGPCPLRICICVLSEFIGIWIIFLVIYLRVHDFVFQGVNPFGMYMERSRDVLPHQSGKQRSTIVTLPSIEQVET